MTLAGNGIKRISWEAVITAVISAAVTACLVLVTWIYSSGRLTGQTTERVQAITERQKALEVRITEQLTNLSDGQREITRALEVLKAEQRILHRGQLGGSVLNVR